MAQSNEAMWAFEHYLKYSPLKGPGGLTNDDITAMADLFYSFNTSAVGTARPALAANFGDCDWPDFTAVVDAGGIQATRDTASIDAARFPESHRGD